jgi:hypothetical protein
MPLPPCASGRDIPGPAGMWMSGAADALWIGSADRDPIQVQCSAAPAPAAGPTVRFSSGFFFVVVVFVFLLVIIMVFFRHSQYNTLS